MWNSVPQSDEAFYTRFAAAIKSAMSTKIELCSVDEVAEGEAKRVETNGLQLAVFNLNGQFYVTDDLCTHGPVLGHALCTGA